MYRLQILCLGDIIMRTRIERIDTNNLYAIFDYFLILRTRIERIDTIFFITDDRPLVYFVWNKGFIILDELLRASS